MNWNSKLNPLGNYKDPYPPDWFKPDSPQLWREFYWFFLRNPLHNLTHCFENSPYRNYKGEIWNPKGGLNLVLPFISYRGKKIEWYIGFRPQDGGFGIALRKRHEN